MYSPLLDWLLIAAFVLGVGVPAAMTIVKPSTSSVVSEFRKPPEFPEVALRPAAMRAFPEDFDAWFKDVFWSRPKLIRWHNAIKLIALRVTPNRIIDVGKNGWIFLGDQSIVDCTRGTNPFSDTELDAWVDALSSCDAWCRERGMQFLFVIAPNKATVYPEEAPARYSKIAPTRMDQLFAALREDTQVQFLDLRPVLAEAKRESPVEIYYPLGTHWNGVGAAAAYEAIVGWVGERFPGVKPLPLRELSYEVLSGGDSWAAKLYLGDLLSQKNPSVKHPDQGRLVTRPLTWIPSTPSRQNLALLGPDPSAPKLFVAHDSFAPWLTNLVAPHFSRSVWVWSGDFPVDVIGSTGSDVVILEMVERMLFQPTFDPAFHMLAK